MTTEQAADLALERATLTLINMVAYAANSLEHAKRFREGTGVDLPTFDIRFLEYLGGRDPVSTSTVAAALGIDLSQASRQASQLEAAGYVTRATDPADRRRTLVSVTEKAAEILDRWVVGWAGDYARPIAAWTDDEVDALESWFRLVHGRLDEALPGRPGSLAAARWTEIVAADQPATTTRFVRTMVGLVAWVGQSGGFNDLLEQHGAPIRQHGYMTLRVVARYGPMSVAEVAERTSAEPSQASKRLSQLSGLGLIDRATDSFDRRVSLVRASRKGAALVESIHTMQLEDFLTILPALPDADRAVTTELARRYVDDLIAGTSAPGPLPEGSRAPRA